MHAPGTMTRRKREKPEPVVERPFTAEDRKASVDTVFRINIKRWEDSRGQFVDKVNEGNLTHAIKWNGYDVFVADALLPYLEVWRTAVSTGLFPHESRNPRSWLELFESVTAKIAEETLRLIEYDDYRHNSTSAMANIENECKFRARQEIVKILTEVLGIMQRPVVD